MPGNANSGRRPQQTDDREAVDPNDRPERPSDLGAIGRAYWDSAIGDIEHLRKRDEPQCVECCRQYELYRRATTACESIPLDDEAAKTAGKYFAQWQSIVKTLGLDPKSRLRHARQMRRVEPKEQSPEAKFFGVVG